MDEVSYILLFLIIIILFFSFFDGYSDISPSLLKAQSSISHFRNIGESAVYRNKIIPSSLFFLKEKIFFCFETTHYRILKDIFQKGMKKGSKSKIYSIHGEKIHEFSYDSIIEKIQSFLTYILNSHPNAKHLGVFLPNTLENFIATAHFSGLTLVVIPVVEEIDPFFFIEIICTIKLDLLITSDDIFSLNTLKKITMVQEIILVSKNNYPELNCTNPTIKMWDNVCNSKNICSKKTSGSIQDTLIMFINIEKNKKFSISEFSHLNVISAYIELEEGILKECKFTEKDFFESTIPYLDHFSRIFLYSAFIAGSSIIFKSEISKISSVHCDLLPTILLTSPETVLHLANKVKLYKNSLIFNFWYKWSNSSLNKGRIPKWIPFIYKSVRTSKLKYLFTNYTLENYKDLNISHIRMVQAGLCIKIIRFLSCNKVFGPISYTNPSDYRYEIHFGPPSSVLEIKIVNHDVSNEKELINGQIFVRGLSVSFKNSKNWVFTGLNGIFRNDGCLVIK